MSSALRGIVDFIMLRQVQMNIARYLSIVSWTVLGYDWITCLDMEVAYIWRSPWSPGRVVYHFNRMWPAIVFCSGIPIFLWSPGPSPTLCKRTVLYYAYGLLAEISSIYSVLLMRYWALHNKKPMLYALLAGLCTSITLSAVFVKITMDRVIYLSNPVPSVFTNGCVVILPSTMWMIYIVPVIYDSVLFIMTVRRVWVLSQDYGSTPLMTRLAENGALHSGVLVVLMMFACIGGRTETLRIASNGSGVLGAMSSVVCSRIIFSLHTLADGEKKQSLPATSEGTTAGDIHFEVPMKELNSTSTTSETTQDSSFLRMSK